MGERERRRILLTNVRLDGRTGTEVLTVEVARGLVARGHLVAVYATSALGASASDLRKSGVVVTNSIEALADFEPQIIHAHHSSPYIVAATMFPRCPAIWFCHDVLSWHDEPNDLPEIFRYVAYAPAIRARLLAVPGISEARIAMLSNATAVEPHDEAPPEQIRNVLIVAKYGTSHVQPITAACRQLNLSVEVVGGGVGRVVSDMSEYIRNADMVVATGKAAMEAIVLNRPVLCADEGGLAGLITHDVSSAWLSRNFGGSHLRQKVETDTAVAEIGLYSQSDFKRMRERVIEKLLMSRYLDEVEFLHDQAIAETPTSSAKSMAIALEKTLPSYRPGGHNPYQAYEWKAEAEKRADAFARQLSKLRLEKFEFGSGPKFNQLAFRPGEAGCAALGDEWLTGNKLNRHGTIRIPGHTGWHLARTIKLEGKIDLLKHFVFTEGEHLPFRVKANGHYANLKVPPEHSQKREGFFYFWHSLPSPPPGFATDLILEFEFEMPDAATFTIMNVILE